MIAAAHCGIAVFEPQPGVIVRVRVTDIVLIQLLDKGRPLLRTGVESDRTL